MFIGYKNEFIIMHGKVLYLEGTTAISDDVKLVLEELNYSVFLADNVSEAERLLKRNAIDLIILDLGHNDYEVIINFVDAIKSRDLPLIFLAGNNTRRIYEEVKQANIMAYLVSPIDLLTLRSVADYALKNSHRADRNKGTSNKYLDDTLFIKVNQLLQRVNINDISHIKSEGNYCLIFTHEKKYAIKLSMVRLYKTLSDKGFLQVHKSYLAKLNKIDNIDISGNEVILGNIRIPLGRKYKQELLAYLNLL